MCAIPLQTQTGTQHTSSKSGIQHNLQYCVCRCKTVGQSGENISLRFQILKLGLKSSAADHLSSCASCWMYSGVFRITGEEVTSHSRMKFLLLLRFPAWQRLINKKWSNHLNKCYCVFSGELRTRSHPFAKTDRMLRCCLLCEALAWVTPYTVP